jgi:TIR domain
MPSLSSDASPPIDLFISYSHADRDVVLAVRQALAARGVAMFLDREQLVAGLPWPQALEDALRRSSASYYSGNDWFSRLATISNASPRRPREHAAAATPEPDIFGSPAIDPTRAKEPADPGKRKQRTRTDN